MDENSTPRSHQLPVAACSQRDRQVLAADFCKTGFRRDLPLEKLHETAGNTLGFNCDGLHYDAVRTDRKTGT